MKWTQRLSLPTKIFPPLPHLTQRTFSHSKNDLNEKYVLVARVPSFLPSGDINIAGPATVLLQGIRSKIIYDSRCGISYLKPISDIRGSLTDFYSGREYSHHETYIQPLEESLKDYPRHSGTKFAIKLAEKYFLNGLKPIPHNETEGVSPCLETLGLFITNMETLDSSEFKNLRAALKEQFNIQNPEIRVYNKSSGTIGKLEEDGSIVPIKHKGSHLLSLQQITSHITEIPTEFINRVISQTKPPIMSKTTLDQWLDGGEFGTRNK